MRKVYDQQLRHRRRKWQLRRLGDDDMDTASIQRLGFAFIWRKVTIRERELLCSDYNDFLNDLEEDAAIRQHVNIYKKQQLPPVVPAEEETTDIPRVLLEVFLRENNYFLQISLAEMLDEMDLSEEEMDDDEEEME